VRRSRITLASFAYAFDRCRTKTVNGAATQFLYDGLDIARQLEAQRTTSSLFSLSDRGFLEFPRFGASTHPSHEHRTFSTQPRLTRAAERTARLSLS